ncbi:MAG: D-alanyl-D-alanine carboxypeptidase family protein [Alphaproteobacteria bacterium]
MRIFLVLIFSFVSFASFAQIDLKSKYVILMDAQTGQVLYEKEADVAVPPSSMSKLMTLYIVFDLIHAGKLKKETSFLVSKTAEYKPASGESAMYLSAGSKVAVMDLIHGISTMSGGDACRTVAENISGSQKKFVSLMNKYAKELGLRDSHFANPTGISHPDHLMSTRDIAKLSQKIIHDFPEFSHIFSMKFFDYQGYTEAQRKEYEFAMWNRNRLLWTYRGADGLKTGHTDKGGYGLAGSATRKEHQLIAVINGLFIKQGRRKANNTRAKEVGLLFDYGFENFKQVTFFEKGEVILDLPIFFGRENQINAILKKNCTLTLKKENDLPFTVKVIYDTPLVAPIQEGERIGTLVFYQAGEKKVEFPLIAEKSVNKIPIFLRVFENLKILIKRILL